MRNFGAKIRGIQPLEILIEGESIFIKCHEMLTYDKDSVIWSKKFTYYLINEYTDFHLYELDCFFENRTKIESLEDTLITDKKRKNTKLHYLSKVNETT